MRTARETHPIRLPTRTWWSVTVGIALTITAFVGYRSIAFAQAKTLTLCSSEPAIELMQALATAYQQRTGTPILVTAVHSSTPANACASGAVALAVVERPLSADDKRAGLVGVPFALNGLALIVHQDNPTTDLSLAEVQALFTGQTTTWKDGTPVVLFNYPITVHARAVFQERVLKESGFGGRVRVKPVRTYLPTVSRVTTGLGYAFASQVKNRGKLLALNGVPLTPATIRDQRYPLVWELLLVTKGKPVGEAKDFIAFIRSPRGQQIVTAQEYVQLPPPRPHKKRLKRHPRTQQRHIYRRAHAAHH